MIIALGSTSSVKKRALEQALVTLGLEAEVVCHPSSSGIADQPLGFEEMFQGASERARQALAATQADFAVGMESGLIPLQEEGYFDVCAVLIVTREGMESRGFGPGLRIPFWMERLVLEQGQETGKIIQERHAGGEKDLQTYFSRGKTTRQIGAEQAIIQAFIPLLNQDLYVE